jgi:hypothetical protein
MWPSLGPERGAAGYLEVFILVAIAVGGSGLVLGVAMRYVGGDGGPAVSIVSAQIRQGAEGALETVAVDDTGGGALGTLVISTSDPPPGAGYCYSVLAPASGTVLSTDCPGSSPFDGEVAVPASVGPGGSLVVELVVTGGRFAVGSAHQVTVTSSGGAQAAAEALVVPA